MSRRGDAGTRGRGEAETPGRGDAETGRRKARGRGDGRRGDGETRRRGDAEKEGAEAHPQRGRNSCRQRRRTIKPRDERGTSESLGKIHQDSVAESDEQLSALLVAFSDRFVFVILPRVSACSASTLGFNVCRLWRLRRCLSSPATRKFDW